MPRRKLRKVFTIAKLQKRARKAHKKLVADFPHISLKLKDLDLDLKDLRRHSAKMLSAAAIAGTLLASYPVLHHSTHQTTTQNTSPLSSADLAQRLQTRLGLILPEKVGALSPAIEDQVHTAIKETLRIDAVGGLEGNHLNTTYGYIGAEQHLPRFPGDTADQHDALQFKGITPGRGAWGHFVSSQAQLTEEDIQKEKYYVAVQTLYLPNWNKDHRTLKEWYKHRKVIVVNPKNGKSVVAVIADAGPAAWTGKHFGGSPELMAELELNTGKQKGAVILFFVDDPNKEVALGPVTKQQSEFLAER